MRCDKRGELGFDIIAHPVMRIKGRLRRVDIKSCAKAKVIPAFRVVGNALTARTGVWGDED